MCRIALTNGSPALHDMLGHLQAPGGNKQVEMWKSGGTTMILNRFAVTSQHVTEGRYPLKGTHYVLCYNGEVYGHKHRNFTDERGHESDVHFALEILETQGIDAFLKDLDFQGSLLIHDKKKNEWYVIVDQLNTTGCFYADYDGTFIVSSEHAVVHAALEQLGAPADVAINIVQNGTYVKIRKDGTRDIVSYRDDAKHVYEGTEYSATHFQETVENVRATLYEATRLRMPVEGDVGVLCSGGLDSSIICSQITRILKEKGELNRLKIFTLGDPNIGEHPEQNDLRNVYVLMESQGLNPAQYLHIIHPSEIAATQQYLLREKVFCSQPRLITPNPILRTQVRHTVMMSALLASIVRTAPGLTSVLTGDAADELFAGYNSMRAGVRTSEDMCQRIRYKLDDLPLNDAARIALSCFHGTTTALKAPFHTAGTIQPLEVRTPFTSHRILQALRDAHPDYVVGTVDGYPISKYLLRMVGIASGLPPSIAMRKKIPFNEGGSGNRNDEPNERERSAARTYCSTAELRERLKGHEDSLRRLHILEHHKQLDARCLSEKHDELALYLAGFSAGLGRLLRGNVFRASMPDSTYTTETNQNELEYLPPPLL